MPHFNRVPCLQITKLWHFPLNSTKLYPSSVVPANGAPEDRESKIKGRKWSTNQSDKQTVEVILVKDQFVDNINATETPVFFTVIYNRLLLIIYFLFFIIIFIIIIIF